jgi:hypothetical protein
MIIGIKKFQYLDNYKLKLFFDNGEIKIVNLESHINGEIFEPLKKIDFFKKIKIDKDTETICWSNGADFSPEFLYEISSNGDK